MKIKIGLITCAIAVISGCGGGGGSSTPVVNAPVVNTAEGFWQGPSSNGANVGIAILENGETWGIATRNNLPVSAISGTATGNGTSFSASGSEFIFNSNSVGTGTYNGTVTQKQRIQATSNNGSTIDLTYDSEYDLGIAASDIAGSYTLSGRTKLYSITNMPLTIDASGNFSSVDGCFGVTGRATPRASGKAIINMTATGTGTCILGNGVSIGGVAILDKSTTPQTILVIALNSGKTDGLILVGTKN